MRVMIASIIATLLTITFVPTSASAQSCRELRAACEFKGALGEEGQGNCRRFREVCGGGGFDDGRRRGGDCSDLRRACEFRGGRACRDFRDFCGGRRRDF